MRVLRLLSLGVALTTAPLFAQDTTAVPRTTLSVYLDCQAFGCDFDYFRTELTMVNWVRDRQLADIHLLVTTQTTGAGGSEYTVTFMGLRQFAGVNDTLRYVAPPASSDDDRRKGLAGVFRLGLVRYFARTPAGARLTVTFPDTNTGSQQTTPKKDPWKAWVFRMSLNGFTYGEEKYKDYNTRASINADRVTEQWKTRVRAGQSYSESRQTYPTCSGTPSVCRDTTYINIRKGDDGAILHVRSLGARLSAGVRVASFSSTYENYRRVVRVFPAIEYNLFPYAQSTRKQLTFEYNVGYGYYAFQDTTVFDKITESFPMHRLLVGIKTRQPWGSIDVGSNATGYLSDRSRYRIGGFGELSLRLFKGFELGVYGGYDKIRDQFNLRKKDFTPEEILTRQFQQGTGYSYYGSMSISYTFGSIFNNVVNPRMVSGDF
jgi:hypothetical protein